MLMASEFTTCYPCPLAQTQPLSTHNTPSSPSYHERWHLQLLLGHVLHLFPFVAEPRACMAMVWLSHHHKGLGLTKSNWAKSPRLNAMSFLLMPSSRCQGLFSVSFTAVKQSYQRIPTQHDHSIVYHNPEHTGLFLNPCI